MDNFPREPEFINISNKISRIKKNTILAFSYDGEASTELAFPLIIGIKNTKVYKALDNREHRTTMEKKQMYLTASWR